MSHFLKKLTKRRIWSRLYVERLAEPVHLNFISLCVFLFGSYRAKIAHDLVIRPHNAHCILKCADTARSLGLKTVSLLEFGVAAGAGLINMAQIAAKVTRSTGINFNVYGFDTGGGCHGRGTIGITRISIKRAIFP